MKKKQLKGIIIKTDEGIEILVDINNIKDLVLSGISKSITLVNTSHNNIHKKYEVSDIYIVISKKANDKKFIIYGKNDIDNDVFDHLIGCPDIISISLLFENKKKEFIVKYGVMGMYGSDNDLNPFQKTYYDNDDNLVISIKEDNADDGY